MNKAMFTALSIGVCGAVFGQLAVTPALPDRGWTHKMWLPRFDAKKALAASNSYDIVFLGDSITHGWESRGAKIWAENFAYHIFVNIGMSIGLTPVTGVPLPFVSYGGSFMLTVMAACGVLQSVYRHRRREL